MTQSVKELQFRPTPREPFVSPETSSPFRAAASELYIADGRLYRQALVRIPRVLFDGTHLGRDVAQISISTIKEAQRLDEIGKLINADRLGRVIYTNFTGALYDWACGDVGDDGFRVAARIAVLAPLAACASEGCRSDLTARLFNELSAPK